MNMTTNAQLNIGNIGATTTATPARTDLSAGADGARSDDSGEGSFDSALQRASKAPESKTMDRGEKGAAASEDVAGHDEELPDDEVSEHEGQASGGAQNQDTAAKSSDDHEDQDTAATDSESSPTQEAQVNPAPTNGFALGVDGENTLRPINTAAEVAGEVEASAQAAIAARDIGPALIKGAIGGSQNTAGGSAAQGPVGTHGSVAEPGLMSFLQLGSNGAAHGENSGANFNQLFAGVEQTAGVRGETGSLTSIITTANPVNGITAVQGQSGPPAPVATPSAAPSAQVTTPFGQAQWANDVGQQLQWMVSQNLQRADLKLNPAHLGPIEVRIVMHHDQVQVSMTATHGQVREALESAVPRLRADLEAGGFGQASVDVGQQGFGEAQGEAGDGDDIGASVTATEGDEDLVTVSGGMLSDAQTTGSGLVDHYA